MSSDAFVAKRQGRWSSHPRWAQWRLRCFARLTLGAILVIALAAVLPVLCRSDGRTLFAQSPRYAQGAGMVLA